MAIDEEFLKSLPTSPGCYMMMDARGKVIYVGKAANLKNRVRNYFVKSGDDRPKIPILVSKVKSIQTILTETEKEAIILENNLIKQHRPRFNVDLRDDKSFFSIRLDTSHDFPKLSLVRTHKIKPDSAKYFGPYSSAGDAKVTLKFIQKLFPLRQCTDRHFASCKRPCLNCQMNKCLCPCAGKVDRQEYGRMVEAVTLLLSGKADDLLYTMQREMEKASRELRFEEAARIRDRISSVQRTLERQNVSFFHLKDQDVIGLIQSDKERFVIEALSFRQGNLLSADSHFFTNPALGPEEVLASFIKQYYSAGAFVPKEILISHPIENMELIRDWLSDLRRARVEVRVPARGQGARLMALALKNANAAMMREKQKDAMENVAQRIRAKLHLPLIPSVIEGYDISNLAGSDPIGVKISFKDGKPHKPAYRVFKMRGFQDQDDPGMIHQTISRRINHREDDPLPDLFLIDGGKSQLNAAAKALSETLGQSAPPVASIAKARKENAQDRIFIVNRKNPINFPQGDPGLMLLMRVRDESHRFAHTAHSKTHGRAVIRSTLDDLPGIGPKKREALLRAFGSLKGLLEAPDERILEVRGVNRKDLKTIRAYFTNTKGDAVEDPEKDPDAPIFPAN
jgi:excinuclease ABC subunit C